ncbi:MAG TPA: uracil-DNA glycosylase [Candidatus Nanoarchaeia archaeon]|nr:uracil-DNA glycosylase [Candidatus Nanoarchaeia archaeon]
MLSLQQLRSEYQNCQRCGLCKNRTQVVFGSGNENAEILLVGEAPGAEEDKQGVPFCGMSGKVLDQLLAGAGLQREDVFITNTVLCRPPNNRNPEKEEIEQCRARLDQLIAILQPKVIVTVGNFATQRILGKTGITSLRGKVFQKVLGNREVTIVPTIHPANYLYSGRNPDLFAKMQQDFRMVVEQVKKAAEQKGLKDFEAW